jgi:hypothetical protein
MFFISKCVVSSLLIFCMTVSAYAESFPLSTVLAKVQARLGSTIIRGGELAKNH